jgi:hypothetical protein
LFVLFGATLLLCLAASVVPSQAGSIGIQGPCSATPGSLIEFKITAAFEETLVPGAYETDLIFDPAVLQLISYQSPVDGRFEQGTFSNLIGQGDLSMGGLSCTETPPTPSSVLGKVRFKAVGPIGSSSRIFLRTPTFLTSQGAFKAVGTLPTQLTITGNPDRDCDGVPDKVDDCPGTYNPTQSDADGNGLGDACDVRGGVIDSFRARVSSGNVSLTWVTSSEAGTSGFVLYRAIDPNGPWELITPSPIPARGNATTGSTYFFGDRTPKRLATVYYQVQAIAPLAGTIDSRSLQILLRRNVRPPAFVKPIEGDEKSRPEGSKP